MFISKPAVGAVVVLGTESSGIYVAHTYTKETFLDFLNGKFIPVNLDSFSSEWTFKDEALKNYSGTLIDTDLKELQTNLKKTSPEGSLKKWCSDKYSEIYKTMIWSAELSVVNEIEKWCTLTFKERATEAKLKNDSELDSSFTSIFKDYTSSDSNPALNSSLQAIKDKATNDETKSKQEFKTWCQDRKDVYFSTPQSQSDWKLFEKFCKKD